MKRHTLTLLTIAFATHAIAQTPAQTPATPAPPTAAKPAEPPLAKHGCTKPELPDGSKKISEARMKVFVASLDGFKDCVTAFAQDQQKTAEQQQKAAQAAVTAANSAIKEYNDFVEQANKVTAAKDETRDLRQEELATRNYNVPKAAPGSNSTVPK